MLPLFAGCVFAPDHTAHAATYNNDLYLQSGLGSGPSAWPTTNRAGQIWYQWRKTDFSGSGDTWMKLEAGFYTVVVGANIFGAGVEMGTTNDTHIHGGTRLVVTPNECSPNPDPYDMSIRSIESTNTYVFNLVDGGVVLADSCNDAFAALVMTEVNHKNALVDIGSPRASNDLAYAYLDASNTAENANSSEEIWYMWTTNDFASRRYAQVTNVTAGFSLPLQIESEVHFGSKIRWVVQTMAASSTNTITGTTGGLLNYDLMPIERGEGPTQYVLRTLLRNPSFETPGDGASTNAQSWRAGLPDSRGAMSNNAIREAWHQRSGTWMTALRGTWAGAGADGTVWQEVTNDFYIGDIWEAGAWFWSDSTYGNTSSKLKVELYDGAGNCIGGNTNTFSPPGENWTYVNVMVTAAVNAAWVRFRVDVAGAGANGALQMDDAILWPTESSTPKVTNYLVNAGANVTDAQVTSGAYSVQMFLRSGIGVASATEGGGYFKPNFDIHNAANAEILSDNIFTNTVGSFTYEGAGLTLNASNAVHPGVAPASVDLGTYHVGVSAISSGLVASAINITNTGKGNLMAFTVVDDDVATPTLAPPALAMNIGTSSVGTLTGDPGFDLDGSSPWLVYGLGSAAISNGIGENGGYGVLLTISTGLGNNGGFYQDYVIKENVSRRYHFSVRGRDGALHFNCAQLILKLEFYDINNVLIYAASNDVVNQVTTDWATYTISATSTPNTVKVRPSVNFDTANGVVGTLGRTNMWDNARLYWATEVDTNPILRVTDGQLAAASASAPLHVGVNGYDAQSGLSRGTASAATQSFVSIANLTTNDVTHYNAAASSSATTNADGSSVWTWSSAFSAAAIDTFMLASNIVVATLRDTDIDRPDDRLSLSNRTAGYFRAFDDDTNYPLKGVTRTGDLIKNGGFETNGAGWVYDAGPYGFGVGMGFTGYAAESDSYGLFFTNATAFAGWGVFAGQRVPVTAGDSYLLSVRARKQGTASIGAFFLKAEFYNAAGGQITPWQDLDITASLTTNWQTFTRSVVPPANVVTTMCLALFYPLSGGDGQGAVYFDSMSFKPANAGAPIAVQIGSSNLVATADSSNAVYSVSDGDLAGVGGGAPLRIALAAYDADSGLARTNTAGAEGSNTTLSVLHLTTNNVANYDPAESTLFPTNTSSSNVWKWTTISAASVDAMIAAGSNAIRATIRDADFDRNSDQLSLSSQLLGYLKVGDDDSGAPVLTGFRPVLSAPGGQASTLSPGDIAIVGYKSLTPDAFTFVTLSSIASGTVIKFTDGGWRNVDTFRFIGEGWLTWSNTAPAGLPFGTMVTITNGDGAAGNQGASTGTVVKVSNYDLSSTDQLIAFQDTAVSTTPLYAVTWNGGAWQADAVDTSSSALPIGLTNGITAIALNVASNMYTMTTSSATRGLLLNAIGNAANWTRVGVALPPAGSFSEYVQLTDANLFNGAWWLAGYVQDTGSGVNSNNTAAGADFGVHYDLLSPSNVTFFADTLFQLQQADGGGRSWATSIASSVSAVPALQNTLGIWTARVSAADNDDDRTGDRLSTVDATVLAFNVIDDDADAPAVANLLGQNLLTNSGFEVAGWWPGIARAWDNTNGLVLGGIFGNYFRTDFRAHGGGYAASIPGQYDGNPNDWGGWFQGATNSYGADVVWKGSAWAFADPVWTGRCFIKIEFYASDNSTLLGSSSVQFAIPSNRWSYVSMLATGPASPGGFARLVLQADQMNTNVASLYFDDASLQVATNTTLPMDVLLGGISYYREGAGITGVYQVTDSDLGTVSPTNPLKFVFRVSDPTSGVARSKSEELFNYDLGTNGSDLTRNIFRTYSSTLSSADTTLSGATSVFAHAENFTLGGYHSGTNFVETGDVFRLQFAVTNTVAVSVPNADEDRGPNDREWFIDSPFGHFVVQDDDTNGPVPTLRYIGANYVPGLVQSNVVTDSELTNALDFAYEWVDASGLFITNAGGAQVNDANVGNLSMNWDLIGPSGQFAAQDAIHPAAAISSPAGNGSIYATVAQVNVSVVVYTNNELGSWRLQASGQDLDNDRGSITHGGQVVNWDRAISPDLPMYFSVIDDDPDAPVVETTNYASSAMMVAYATDATPGSGGAGSNRLFTITDEEMLGMATNPLRLVFNVWDASSGVARATTVPASNMHIAVSGWVTNNVTNYNASGSAASTTSGGSTSQWTFTNPFALADVNAMMSTTSRVYAAIPDADNDRIGDTLWVNYRQMGLIRWQDDSSTLPQLRSFGGTNAALQLYVGGHPGLGYGGTNVWENAYPGAVTNEHQRFLVTDGDLAGASPAAPLDFNIWVYDTQNGLARDTLGALSNSSLTIGSAIVSNVANYNGADSAVFSQTKLSFNSTNLWRFTSIPYTQVTALYAAPGGSNRMTLHALNADFDRGPTDQDRADTNLGWLVVRDDDTVGPAAPTNAVVDVLWWTNRRLFNVMFNAVTSDASSVYQYRYDTNTTPSAWTTNGDVVPSSATVLPVAAFSNGNFEVGGRGQALPDLPANLHGWADVSSANASSIYWNVAQSGTGSMRQVIDAGSNAGQPRYALMGQQAWIGNTNGYPVLASMSAWFSGDVSRVANGVTGTAFMRMEFLDAATTVLAAVDNAYNQDHNGSPLHGVNCTGWSNATITATNGPAGTRLIRFLVGVAQRGTDLPMTGTWDNVAISVSAVGPEDSVYMFPMTNALEGLRTNWLFAVDDDNDRLNDRMKSGNIGYTTMLDVTPPVTVTNFIGTNGLDESSEVSLTWTALTNAGHRAGDGDPLSPWRTYYVFFTTNANVTTNDASLSFTNAGYGVLHTNTTAAINVTNLEFDTTYRFAIAGQDRAGNLGLLSRTAEVTTLSFIVTQGLVNALSDVNLSWLASPGKVYDVLWEDGLGYSDSFSNEWQKMAGRVTNSWMVDGGDTNRAAPKEMVNTLRFYRVSREGQWATNASPRRASREIYVSKTWQLRPGENWISMPFLPETNRYRVKDVFGTNLLPRSTTMANSTKISWYGHTLAGGGGASVATNLIWLTSNNRWEFSLPPQFAGQVADNFVVPTNEAFNIEIPMSVSTQKFVMVGRLPTNVMTMTIHGANGQTNYSVLSWGTPYRVRVKDLGLIGASFSGGVNVTRSDEIRILDNSSGMGTKTLPKMRIWRNATTNFYLSPSGALANDYVIEPGEAIIIVRKRGPSLVWTNKLYYSLPGKNINP